MKIALFKSIEYGWTMPAAQHDDGSDPHLGSYVRITEYVDVDFPPRAPDWKPQAFHLLRVAKESADFAHHYYGELEDAKAQFLLFRQAYDIDTRLKKRAA